MTPLTTLIACLSNGWFWSPIPELLTDSGIGYYTGHGYYYGPVGSGSGAGNGNNGNGDGCGGY